MKRSNPHRKSKHISQHSPRGQLKRLAHADVKKREMKKIFKFQETIPATIVQYYEVIAETEEEALAMVQNGKGYQETFTDENGDGEIELYDTEELPE